MPQHQSNADFDYIVIGSGAGGGPLAANLARAGFRVLVMEAGSDDANDVMTQVPAFHSMASKDEDISWEFFVDHYSQNPERDFKY